MTRRAALAVWALFVVVWISIAISLLYPKVLGECGWFAPKIVQYHDGMTLCPGQAAHIRIILKEDSGNGI